MIIEREVGEKGQVVIPKDIRKFLGLNKGSKVVFEFKDKEIVLKSKDPVEFLEDFLNIPKRLEKGIKMSGIKGAIYEQYEVP